MSIDSKKIFNTILNKVAHYYKQDISDVEGGKRNAELVKVRCIVSTLAHNHFSYTLVDISKFLNKHRVSISHLINTTHVGYWKTDKKYRHDFSLLYSELFNEIKGIEETPNFNLEELNASIRVVENELLKIKEITSALVEVIFKQSISDS